MALHRFAGMEIGAPAPEKFATCYRELGLAGERDCWGTADLAEQIKVVETPYRQLVSMRIGYEHESDLTALRHRPESLGIDSRNSQGRALWANPSGSRQVSVKVAPRSPRCLARVVLGSSDPTAISKSITDMDDIPDHDTWAPRTDWEIGHIATWGPKEPPNEFAFPADLEGIANAREAEGR